MIWTRNLLIWSQTRYRCATRSLHYCVGLCVCVCVHTFQCLNRLQVGVLHWRNWSMRGTPAEQCQGCEFAPHLEQSSILPKITNCLSQKCVWSTQMITIFGRWPWRDLNTQPSDLESDALPLRHKVTVSWQNSPTKTWHHSHTGALVTYCGCVCMCTPKKPYSESTMFRLYSLWIYN